MDRLKLQLDKLHMDVRGYKKQVILLSQDRSCQWHNQTLCKGGGVKGCQSIGKEGSINFYTHCWSKGRGSGTLTTYTTGHLVKTLFLLHL